MDYEKPRITAHREDLLASMKDVMYFYYNIDILDEKNFI